MKENHTGSLVMIYQDYGFPPPVARSRAGDPQRDLGLHVSNGVFLPMARWALGMTACDKLDTKTIRS